MKRNLLYAQSGGVTAVINASAAGVIEAARSYDARIGRTFAARNGILGALREDLIDTDLESRSAIAALKHTPGGAFGSCRFKLKAFSESRAQYARLLEVFAAHEIGYFLYNGGNDSADTALKVAEASVKLGYPVTCVAVPKTIDNDLAVTDNCPGFGSVAKYVATSVLEAALDVQSMCASSTKVFVLEVMGRHAGWIAAAAGLAQRAPHDIPLTILFPEVPFAPDAFLARVERDVQVRGYACVVVSEGVRDEAGHFLSEGQGHDAFGHAQLGGAAPKIAALIERALKLKQHWAVADYLQRSARHIASKTDVEQAYAVGRVAVDLCIEGRNATMPIIERLNQDPYQWQIGVAELKRIANKEKKLPRKFLSRDGFGITAECRDYLAPLTFGEAPPPYRDGLPDYVKLKRLSVARKLAPFVIEDR
jgi:ATP-dependent phosphofructokinase / diphosphate-dependent phosphofructokinase